MVVSGYKAESFGFRESVGVLLIKLNYFQRAFSSMKLGLYNLEEFVRIGSIP